MQLRHLRHAAARLRAASWGESLFPQPRPRRRATYTRPHGVRHLFAGYDLGKSGATRYGWW